MSTHSSVSGFLNMRLFVRAWIYAISYHINQAANLAVRKL